MIRVKFKNLESSEIAREAVLNRIEGLVEKFPKLNESRIVVLLEMENSPHKPGPDLFRVKVQIFKGVYDDVSLNKAHENLYVALAEVVDTLLERLNRFSDRERVTKRRQARMAMNAV
jgi:ribosome-associated translation inhibitor RaiA